MSTQPSILAQTLGPQDQAPSEVTLPPQDSTNSDGSQLPQAPQGGSRLLNIVKAIASVGSTAMAGIPDKGRSSFITGLGQGARAAQAAEATQQAIKFKTFDDQVRAANLTHQDKELQLRSQEQQDAHQKFQDWQHDWNQDHGISDDIIPNTGDAVTDHLTAQTSANGAASIPAGTHLGADGTSIHVPTDTQATRDGQLQQYKTFAPAYGLPSLPENASFVPPRLLDALTHSMQGYALDGTPLNHDVIPQKIAALQAQRDQLAKKGDASPSTLTGLDNTIGILKANLKALDDHQDQVFAKQTKQKAIEAGAVETAKQKAALPFKEQLQDNAASNKAQKGSDNTELNAVAFDPNYQNPDGSKGANVVMNKADASAKGLTHYKANPEKLNALVAGFNDVQNKLNQLASVVNDPKRMAQVQTDVAASALSSAGLNLGAGAYGAHVGIPTDKVNAVAEQLNLMRANQATKDFIVAALGAHEAITQLPRLQTFGQSSRMTQQQMEAALNLLPRPSDGTFAAQKMTSLQGMIDPLRKQVPHMPGAESIPSWLEQRQQKQHTPSTMNSTAQSNLAQWVGGLK